MKQMRVFFWLILFVAGAFVWAGNEDHSSDSSKDLKITIEQYIKNYENGKIFYVWVDQKLKNKLLKNNGQWNEKLYWEMLKIYPKGYEVHEKIPETSGLGSEIELLEVELKPGRYFLDRSAYLDLLKQGISLYEVKLYFSNTAVEQAFKEFKESYGTWNLLGWKGVVFKSFSGKELSIEDLFKAYEKMASERNAPLKYFMDTIRDEVLSRKEKGIPSVQTMEEGAKLLRGWAQYFPEEYVNQLVNKNIAPYIQTVDEAKEFLSVFRYLERKFQDRWDWVDFPHKEVVKIISPLLKTKEDKLEVLLYVEDSMMTGKPSEFFKDHILNSIDTVEGGNELLKDIEKLRLLHKIRGNTLDLPMESVLILLENVQERIKELKKQQGILGACRRFFGRSG